MAEPVRLVLPPGESTRLAATRPGEVVEVWVAKLDPLRYGVPRQLTVSADGWICRPAGEQRGPGHPPAPPPARLLPHPAPAVGAEVWVPEEWGAGCRPDSYSGYRDGIEYRADVALLETDFDLLPLYSKVEPPDDWEWDSLDGWQSAESMPEWAARLRATVTALGARQYDCEECGGSGEGDDYDAFTCVDCDGEGDYVACIDDLCHRQERCIHGEPRKTCPSCKGRGEIVPRCPTCQGTPPWWATVALRREGA